ncbi:MAG TPA: hypothetical protein VM802_13515 [Chitinophaga sp.]|uniref:hypothetical protein n=1 Tax=Chitinophaga sp. TaxID=1869181 RepID=UPI002C27DBEB|nr:hypothetical protein [Chitinophaga sp.]HVI45887.1 hypothetical protein [Chitinophaga sp.]
MTYIMQYFNNLGIGELQLGKSLEQINPLNQFGPSDRDNLIPGPDGDAWFKYMGEITGLSDGKSLSFPAESIYLAVNPVKKVNRIWIYPKTEVIGVSIENLLSNVYGNPMISSGGMAEIGGTTSYTNYFYVSKDKVIQVAYHKVFDVESIGPEHISFRFINDDDAFKYNLTYRTWKKYM